MDEAPSVTLFLFSQSEYFLPHLLLLNIIKRLSVPACQWAASPDVTCFR